LPLFGLGLDIFLVIVIKIIFHREISQLGSHFFVMLGFFRFIRGIEGNLGYVGNLHVVKVFLSVLEGEVLKEFDLERVRSGIGKRRKDGRGGGNY
jgi:hypothetical protein